MPTELKWLGLLGLVTGGVALGAMLATFVDPVPRHASGSPAPVGRADFTPAPSYVFVETGPEDLSPPAPPNGHAPDGYAPDWAQADQGIWRYSEPVVVAWEPIPFPSLAELEAQLEEDRARLDAAAEAARAEAPDEVGAAADEPAPPRSAAARPGPGGYLAPLY